jgi:hypothetical protein
MRKATRNYILFIFMLLLALMQAASGFILWLAVPGSEGYRGGRGAVLGGQGTFLWERHTWINLHDWLAVALLVMVVIHLILHWKWIVYMTKSPFKER